MIAPRTLADTHSETNTVAKITSKIVETCVHARVLIDPFNCKPIPPAPTRPNIVDSLIFISQRYIPTPAIVGNTWGIIP